jgi:hypothetical protein
MTKAQIQAKEIYDNMKGFRITNKHRKSTTKKAVQLSIDTLKTSTGHLTLSLLDRQELQNDFDFLDEVLKAVEEL